MSIKSSGTKTYMLYLSIALATVAMGCSKDADRAIETPVGMAEKTGNAVGTMASNTVEAAKRTADAAKDASDRVVDKTGEILEQAGDGVKRAGESIQQ